MPAQLRIILTTLIVMGLGALATKLKISATDNAGNIIALATALASLPFIIIETIMQRRTQRKIKRAETIAPGITTIPKGSETVATLIVNDPKTPDPPDVTTTQTKSTP